MIEFLPGVEDGFRICGTCGKTLELEKFYKDGRNSKGEVRYRRDCIQCYQEMRIKEYNRKKGAKKYGRHM